MTTTTRWLTDEEQHTWRLYLTACQSAFASIEAQLLRDSGLPHGYYEILVHLSETPGRALRMSQLAAASSYSKSRLSHAVSKLEARGLVARLDCPTDRRGQIAQLTEKGFALLEEAAPGHVDQVRRSVIDALSPEQIVQLGEISAAIVAAATGQVRGPCAAVSMATVDAEVEADSGCFGGKEYDEVDGAGDDGTCPG
ncbi:MAG TPA: MarR family transcriptional regulator [Streptosporangiaceae bacterium]|nr:MarR family transcriptional regulator [Streptosporangiaceae bacterium]